MSLEELIIIKSPFLLYKKVAEQYKDQRILESVKELIPRDVLRKQDDNKGNITLLVSLLKWFKDDFMHWTPSQIECQNCSTRVKPPATSTTCITTTTDEIPITKSSVIMQSKVLQDNSWKLRKTEIHTCNKCGSIHYFPRYGEVLRIAETRTGRCSEWSILFGAILNSVSLQARIVHDYLDHCWNEVLIEDKWIHTDSTLQYPISLNHPYYYEQNWKKKYRYVLAFEAHKVEDVTKIYTQEWDNVLSRRWKKRRKGLLGNILNNINNEHEHDKKEEALSAATLQSIYSSIA